MSTAAELPKSQDLHALPPARPLDEAVWQAWVLKARGREARSRVVWRRAVTCISLAGLLFVAVTDLWPHPVTLDVVVRFIVAVGAAMLMFQAFALRDYAFGTLFGVLALLYNPVTPLFGVSGGWQSALVGASAFPFVASFLWRDAKLVPNENN